MTQPRHNHASALIQARARMIAFSSLTTSSTTWYHQAMNDVFDAEEQLARVEQKKKRLDEDDIMVFENQPDHELDEPGTPSTPGAPGIKTRRHRNRESRHHTPTVYIYIYMYFCLCIY
jgi:hypothetical protein